MVKVPKVSLKPPAPRRLPGNALKKQENFGSWRKWKTEWKTTHIFLPFFMKFCVQSDSCYTSPLVSWLPRAAKHPNFFKHWWIRKLLQFKKTTSFSNFFLVNKLFGFVVDPDLHGRKSRSRNSFSRPNFHLGKFNSAVVTFDTKTGLHNFQKRDR